MRIPTTSAHRTRLTLAGWVAPELGRSGVVRVPRGDRAGFLCALRHLARRLRGYTIWQLGRWRRPRASENTTGAEVAPDARGVRPVMDRP